MRKTLALAAALFLGLTAAASAGIAGHYTVAGTNLDGSTYGGTVEIVATSENTCRISWDDGATASGICMRNRNAFAAGYEMNGAVGLVIYQILEDGTLDGLWTVADQNGWGTEKLTPMH